MSAFHPKKTFNPDRDRLWLRMIDGLRDGNSKEVGMGISLGRGLHAPAGKPGDSQAYERWTGRWSRMFVPKVIAAARVAPGDRVLDVSAGTGEAALVALNRPRRLNDNELTRAHIWRDNELIRTFDYVDGLAVVS